MTTRPPTAANAVTVSLTMQHVPTHSLVPASWNPRRISAKARDRLRAGLTRFGFVQPVVARTEDRLIVGGHQRWELACELQLETVPVIFLPGLSDAQAKALAVLLNNKDAQGEWEISSLTTLLEELRMDPLDDLLSATGFDDATLDKFLAPDGDADATLTPIEVRPMGSTVWVLIGVPARDYPALADTVQRIAEIPDAFVEVVANDQAAA
ncbi:ParB N-terminal domain-containing protein [Gemmatimonas sp.]